MREILFRGKSTIVNEWRYGALVNVNDEFRILEDCDIEQDGHHFIQASDRPTWVIENTIGQFTGLTDCNGNKIFEGDVVVVESLNHMSLGQKTTCCISYLDGAYTMVCGDRTALLFIEETNNHIEVVGNIHDNHELIKGGK